MALPPDFQPPEIDKTEPEPDPEDIANAIASQQAGSAESIGVVPEAEPPVTP